MDDTGFEFQLDAVDPAPDVSDEQADGTQWHLNPDMGTFILADTHRKDAWMESDTLEEIRR